VEDWELCEDCYESKCEPDLTYASVASMRYVSTKSDSVPPTPGAALAHQQVDLARICPREGFGSAAVFSTPKTAFWTTPACVQASATHAVRLAGRRSARTRHE
jgi:hypothetical protein